jgi:DNA-binding NarL/FixJ family response regulator
MTGTKQSPSQPRDPDHVIRVLIVDDHELIRLGLEAVLGAQPDLDLCGGAADGLSAVELARVAAPDVVVMDVSMPLMDGFATTQAILGVHPSARVVMLSWRADRNSVRRAFAAGASAYLLKETDWTDVLAAIRSVDRGERPRSCVGCEATGS